MELSEPYEDGGKWYSKVILQEDEQVAQSLSGVEVRGGAGHSDRIWRTLPEGFEWVFHHLEYRVPAKPPEPNAIPTDSPASTAPKSWRFRHDPWVTPQPKTLADVPNRTACICFVDEIYVVVCRVDEVAYGVGKDGEAGLWYRPPPLFPFVRYLDPAQPAPLRLEDVPDGRLIEVEKGEYLWKQGDQWWQHWSGETTRHGKPDRSFTVTDHVAEFK